MAGTQTPEQTDALYRARAEVTLLVGKYQRRLKTAAEDIALSLMIENPNRDPDEVGIEAFETAGKRTKLIAGKAKSAKALNR